MGCAVAGCGGALFSSGMCSKHYNRLRTRGTVEDGPRARRPFLERLWSQIKRGGKDECWPWVAKSNVRGYGVIGIGGRDAGKILAHRAAWQAVNGPIPDGLHACHKCDNPKCCNPSHMFLGTDKDNLADMRRKARAVNAQLKGQFHNMAKFTDALVLQMRSSHQSDRWWANKLGVTRQAVSYARRKGWAHLNK